MAEKYILHDGKPVLEPDLMKWGEWFEKADRQIALTEGDKFIVSTVFLGLDHSFGGDEPILFETMAFKRADWDVGDSLPDEDCNRYSTVEDALAGHEEMVRKWQSHAAPDPFARWEAAKRENERTLEAIRESCDSIAAGLAAQAEALRTIRDELAEKKGAA